MSRRDELADCDELFKLRWRTERMLRLTSDIMEKSAAPSALTLLPIGLKSRRHA